MKQPYGSTLPVSPTAGDHCYLDDGTLHFCYVDGVWTQISGGGGGTFEYGSFGIAVANETTWSRSSFPTWVRFKAADIFDNSALYYRCTWDVLEVDDSGTIYNTWEGLQFADTAALYAFVAANFTESGSVPGTPLNHAYVRVYDVIGASMPKIDKIWGINTFYSILKGRNSYRTNKYNIDNGTPNWSSFSTWFNDLCNQNMGFGPGHTYTVNDEKALWFTRNEAKVYGMPYPGYLCTIGTNGGRWVWDWGSSDFVTLPAIRSYSNTPSSGSQQIYCALNLTTLTSWDWIPTTSVSQLIQILGSGSYSLLSLYQLEDNADSNYRSIQIKPYGVDRLGLTWFDTSAYDLFALYTRKNTTPIMRHITSLGLSSAVKDLQWVEYNNWKPPDWGSLRARLSMRMVGKQPYTTQFFLRDKTTDVVSPVSKARVVRTQRHRDAAFKYEVRR